jgi:hypothetical protein
MNAHPRSWKASALWLRLLLAWRVLPLLLVGACATSPFLPPGESSIRDGVYVNDTYGLTLRFEDPTGWEWLTEEERLREVSPTVMFGAMNLQRFLFVQLMVEDSGVEVANEVYQPIYRHFVESSGREIVERSLDEVDVNGHQALVWRYMGIDSLGEVTTQAEYAVAFFQRDTQNATLEIWCLSTMREVRQTEIDGIVESFDW